MAFYKKYIETIARDIVQLTDLEPWASAESIELDIKTQYNCTQVQYRKALKRSEQIDRYR